MQPTVQQETNYHDQETQTSSETLWGTKARRLTGTLQQVLGVLEIILVIVWPLELHLNFVDYIGWGIWCGAFSILAGCFGIASHRSKSVVITYMVLSIIAAVICAYCTYQQIKFAYNIKQNPYVDGNDAKSQFIVYVTLAVIMFLQGVASIIGASFTCGALCHTQATSGQEEIYYVLGNATQEMVGFVPQPTTVVIAGQPPKILQSPNSAATHR